VTFDNVPLRFIAAIYITVSGAEERDAQHAGIAAEHAGAVILKQSPAYS
jgi:hypothetical protein